MVTANVIHRVFNVRIGDNAGTAFTIEHDSKQYLITAAHLINGVNAPYSAEVLHDGKWTSISLKLTGISPVADIVVFSPPHQMSVTYSLPATSAGVVCGQDVYFLGFPYNLTGEPVKMNAMFPLPLIKKACLSGWIKNEFGAEVTLLDGHNNPGFSGGPVVFSEYGKPLSSALKVMGVISAYRFELKPIYNENQSIPMYVRENTGIIISYSIQNAIDEITKNPNGFPVEVGR